MSELRTVAYRQKSRNFYKYRTVVFLRDCDRWYLCDLTARKVHVHLDDITTPSSGKINTVIWNAHLW